jgi:hypothetical protein
MFFKIHEHTEMAFKINLYINILVVAVEALMLVYSIIYS